MHSTKAFTLNPQRVTPFRVSSPQKFYHITTVKCLSGNSTFQLLLLPSLVTIDTKNHLILLICLYKTSDEGVYRKAKNDWNYRSLFRHLSTVIYNFVLYFNGIIIRGITDRNY